MDFPDGMGSRAADPPKHIMSEPERSEPPMEQNRPYDEPAPAAHASDRVTNEVISVETMRGAMVTNFEQDDLDVPAFLRKRNDVM